MSSRPIQLDGERLTLDQLFAVALERLPAEIPAAVALRANALAKGFSGVRPVAAETLVAMLNRGVLPVIPSKGSVGASGDLAPLAHLAQVVIGEGYAIYEGKRLSGADAMRAAG